MLRACKTSVSYETSSKSHASSLQNKRFVRDFLQKSRVKSPKQAFRRRPPLQKSHVKSPKRGFRMRFPHKSHAKSTKRAFRTRLPQKLTSHESLQNETSSQSQAETPIGAHTSRSPASSFAIPAPPNNTRSHANPNVTATLTSTATHDLMIPCACRESFRVHAFNAHKVLRLPRNVTSVTPRNLTIPCACHETCTSAPQNPHKELRLPRKVTISFHVSFNKICTTPHAGMISTRSEHTPIHQNCHFS